MREGLLYTNSFPDSMQSNGVFLARSKCVLLEAARMVLKSPDPEIAAMPDGIQKEFFIKSKTHQKPYWPLMPTAKNFIAETDSTTRFDAPD